MNEQQCDTVVNMLQHRDRNRIGPAAISRTVSATEMTITRPIESSTAMCRKNPCNLSPHHCHFTGRISPAWYRFQ